MLPQQKEKRSNGDATAEAVVTQQGGGACGIPSASVDKTSLCAGSVEALDASSIPMLGAQWGSQVGEQIARKTLPT